MVEMNEIEYEYCYKNYAKYIKFKQYKKICKYKKILIDIDSCLDSLKHTLQLMKKSATMKNVEDGIKNVEDEIETQYDKFTFWKIEYENYLKNNKLFKIYESSYNYIYMDNEAYDEICEIYEFLNNIRTSRLLF